MIISILKRIPARADRKIRTTLGQVEDPGAEGDLGEQEPLPVFLDPHVLEVGRERPGASASTTSIGSSSSAMLLPVSRQTPT